VVGRSESRCGQVGWKCLGWWRCTASAATGSTWNQDFSKHTCCRTSIVREDLVAQWYDGMGSGSQRKVIPLYGLVMPKGVPTSLEQDTWWLCSSHQGGRGHCWCWILVEAEPCWLDMVHGQEDVGCSVRLV